MISIANPIYDSVFKYLVEDERVTKTLLSALLKRVNIEEGNFTGDHEMQLIIHRLLSGRNFRF